MSESNLSKVRLKAETVFGTTPASPAFKELLVRSSSLKHEPQTVTDDQISGDRSIRDANLVGYDVSGDIQCRLTYGALDDIFESLLYSTWTKTAEALPSAVTAGTHYTVASGGTNFPVGALIYASGFGTAGNNGLKTVTASTGTTVAAAGLTAEASPPAGAMIKLVGMADASGAAALTAAPNVLTFSNLNPTNFGIVAGMWLKLGGTATGNKFATAADNGWYRVSAVSATTITFDVVPTGFGADNGSSKTIYVFIPDIMRDGSTRKSFAVERQYTNSSGTSYYEYFNGIIFGQGRLQMQPRQNIEVNFDVMGLTASAVDTTRFTGATSVAADESDVMNTSSNVGQIRAGGSALSGAQATTSANITVNNNLRTREGIGSQAVIDVRAGRFDVQVEMTGFFEDTTQINKVRNDTETSFDTVLMDPDNNAGYVVDLPRGKYTAGEIQPGRIDTDITVPLTMQALRHATLGYTMQLARFAHLEM